MAIGIAVGTPMGLTATLYYLLAYLLMNVGAFLGVIAVENATGREDLAAFSGLSQRAPALSFMMTVALLSLAGIPPMAGFFAKLWIFGAALETKHVGLAVVAAVNSVIALFYYAKIIKSMYLDPAPALSSQTPTSWTLRMGLALCTAGLILVGLMPGPWLVLAADLPWL
jgi:NADH-quinone oxidoreductase subunit N